MKILFNIPKLGIGDVYDHLQWRDKKRTRIVEMTDSHLVNTISWLSRAISIYEEGDIYPCHGGGWTYEQWRLILKAEQERRRKEKVQQIKNVNINVEGEPRQVTLHVSSNTHITIIRPSHMIDIPNAGKVEVRYRNSELDWDSLVQKLIEINR